MLPKTTSQCVLLHNKLFQLNFMHKCLFYCAELMRMALIDVIHGYMLFQLFSYLHKGYQDCTWCKIKEAFLNLCESD